VSQINWLCVIAGELSEKGSTHVLILISNKSSMRKSSRPLELHFCGLSGRVNDSLTRLKGFPVWQIGKYAEGYIEIFESEKENLVYLSPDAPDVLESVSQDKIYIVGAIADGAVKKVHYLQSNLRVHFRFRSFVFAFRSWAELQFLFL